MSLSQAKHLLGQSSDRYGLLWINLVLSLQSIPVDLVHGILPLIEIQSMRFRDLVRLSVISGKCIERDVVARHANKTRIKHKRLRSQYISPF